MKSIDPGIIRQIFVLLLILAIAYVLVGQMAPYLSGVLGTITLYVILTRPLRWLVGKGMRLKWATVLLMFVSFITILLPVVGAIFMLGNKLGRAVKNSKKVGSALKLQVQDLEGRLGINFLPDTDSMNVSDWLSKNLEGLAGGTFYTVISIAIMYFLLY